MSDPSAGAGPPELTPEELEFLHATFDLARAGETDRLVDLVRQGVPVDLTDPKGDTFLVLAAYYDHDELVARLLDLGADPDRVDDRGQTALVSAVYRRNATNVRALLAAGADPAAGSRTAREVADYFDLPDMRAVLDEFGA